MWNVHHWILNDWLNALRWRWREAASLSTSTPTTTRSLPSSWGSTPPRAPSLPPPPRQGRPTTSPPHPPIPPRPPGPPPPTPQSGVSAVWWWGRVVSLGATHKWVHICRSFCDPHPFPCHTWSHYPSHIETYVQGKECDVIHDGSVHVVFGVCMKLSNKIK